MRPYPTILLLTALALLGYGLLPRLTIRWEPGPARTDLRVSYVWPGTNPQVLEQQVTAPLEGALALLRGVEAITSVSRSGRGRVDLSIDPAADPDFVRFNVAAQVRRLYSSLPDGVTYPVVEYATAGENDRRDRPVLTYTLSGPDPPTELFRYASEQLVPRLSLLDGLSRLTVTGGNRNHWLIRLDPRAMASAGLTRRELSAYLSAYLDRRGLGFLTVDGYQLSAYLQITTEDNSRAEKETISPGERLVWEEIPIPSPTARQLRLGDLATVNYQPLPPTSHYRINGQNSVRLLAYATPAANRLLLATNLRDRVLARQNDLPAGYALRLEEDTTRFLREELAKTRQRTALSMGILLLFVLVAYRSLRRLLVVGYALTVNLGLAFLTYWLLGVELNLYAFAGIAVSFGIMIDNLIIVIDKLRRNEPDAPGVSAPVIGATLTTLASLSVIYFLSEEVRHQLYELVRVMTINLSTSVLVALVFVPALEHNPNRATSGATTGVDHRQTRQRDLVSSRLSNYYASLLGFAVRQKILILLFTVLAFGLPVWLLPDRVEGAAWYNQTVGSDYYRDHLRPTVNKVLGGTLRLFTYYVYEGSGYRPPEETKLYVGASLGQGTTLEQIDAVTRNVEAYLATFGAKVDRFTTYVGPERSRITITFPNGGRGAFPYTLKNRLTSYATNFGGVKWNIYGVGPGFSNDPSSGNQGFRILLKGYDQTGLDVHSARLAELLLRHPRVQEVDTDANLDWWRKGRTELLLLPDRRALARRELTAADLRATLEWFDRNDRPEFYLSDGTPVALTANSPEAYDRWRLENWSIPRDSAALDFPELARLEQRPAALALYKEDQQYLRLVEFDYLGSPRFGARHLNACLDTLRAELPLGFTAERREYRYQTATTQQLGLMGLAVVLVFFICALLFESLRQAFNIILLIPVSCIGVFLTFYWFGVRLDQGGYVSFLLVTGLAVNGLILVVNEYNGLRRRHPEETGVRLYARALGRKLTPIVLTVVSTAAGLLPFLLGGRTEVFWHALAAGTIGGLAFSLLVIVFISPVFFLRRPALARV